ncbi:hypothetical protein [Synechococcus sp. MIT S9508]|uniref:hypothetical protein n=1 Tax=Synechococcus sp. MIT S9508 TaxID=1801629 RepID=UPI0007BB3D9F|nr:hypothetical protein [Synechococcus sp. MIT S9508]KZR87513.1 hypothetical protein MITS9508_02466 [Synechococcus sp. MIT S9508]
MKLLIVLLMFGLGSLELALGLNTRSQSVSSVVPFYENFRQGQYYWSYLIKAEKVGIGKWQIKTKTIYDTPSNPYFSESIVDCKVQTIARENGLDLKIPKDWLNTAEMGLPELYEAVCEKKPE